PTTVLAAAGVLIQLVSFGGGRVIGFHPSFLGSPVLSRLPILSNLEQLPHFLQRQSRFWRGLERRAALKVLRPVRWVCDESQFAGVQHPVNRGMHAGTGVLEFSQQKTQFVE